MLAALVAAPGPKTDPKSGAIFPTQPGATWEYRVAGKTVVHRLAAAETKDGVVVLSIVEEGRDGKSTPVERLRESEKGVFRVEAVSEKVDPPLCLLQLPHVPEQEWETADTDGRVKGKHRAAGPEEVAVHAGKFRAVRVDSEYTFAGVTGTARRTDWYAAGVGRVKSVYSEGGTTWELSAFTPGKR